MIKSKTLKVGDVYTDPRYPKIYYIIFKIDILIYHDKWQQNAYHIYKTSDGKIFPAYSKTNSAYFPIIEKL